MDKRFVEKLLNEQLQTIKDILKTECLTRYISKKINPNEQLQIIQGVRGVGKTFTTIHALNSLNSKFAYIDISKGFERLETQDFDSLYESLLMVYGKFDCLLVDEFYRGLDWNAMFSYMLNIGVNVIGICSGIFSVDLFPSQSNVLNFYPLSFSEYCIWHNIDTTLKSPENVVAIRKGFDDFIFRGGFPELQDKKRLHKTINRILDSILEQDLKSGYRESMAEKIVDLFHALLDNPTNLINYKQIAIKYGMHSEITVKKYIEILKCSGFFYSLMRFAEFDKIRNVYEKTYLVDHVLIEEDEKGKRFENAVYMQLRRFCERNGYHMHYFANRNTECNFALCADMKMRTIIQVMADYHDSEIVKEKVRGLIALSKSSGCSKLFILTDTQYDVIEEKGLSITVMPIYDFLIDRSHKIVLD